jgi:hypothetical protein
LYIGTFKDEFSHNPPIRMKTPLLYETEDTSPDIGMQGGAGRVSAPSQVMERNADFYTSNVTGEEVADEFYPVCGALAGSDLKYGEAITSFTQRSTYMVSSPHERMVVPRVMLAFSAFGSASADSGDVPCFPSEYLYRRAVASCRLRLRILQEGWSFPRTLIDHEIASVHHDARFPDTQIVYFEHTEPLVVTPGEFLLLESQEGSRYIIAQVELQLFANAGFRNAHARISFEQPGGIRIDEIALLDT